MPVAAAALGMRKEALRNDQMQVVPSARHRDVKKTALFLDFRELPASGSIKGVCSSTASTWSS
jgi:hypothetical protein